MKKKPQTIGWGRPNLMCSVEDKILEVVLKDGMIGQTINQTHEPRLAQDFS
jgi:hypothetical protein